MNARRLPEEAAPEPLNMTPMIDIVFQLLIFFMLTMQFKEVEGKLLSQLPKSPGLSSGPSTPREELRIAVCADGNLDDHLSNRGRHDKAPKDGARCRVFVERHAVGELASTEKAPSSLASNKSVYRGAAAKARDLRAALGTSARITIVLDADPEVPYEHVIGVVDACKEASLESLEFVGNARFEKYYR